MQAGYAGMVEGQNMQHRVMAAWQRGKICSSGLWRHSRRAKYAAAGCGGMVEGQNMQQRIISAG